MEEVQGSMFLVTVSWQSQGSSPPHLQHQTIHLHPFVNYFRITKGPLPDTGFTTTLNAPISSAAWPQLSRKRDISSHSGDAKEEALPQPNPWLGLGPCLHHPEAPHLGLLRCDAVNSKPALGIIHQAEMLTCLLNADDI